MPYEEVQEPLPIPTQGFGIPTTLSSATKGYENCSANSWFGQPSCLRRTFSTDLSVHSTASASCQPPDQNVSFPTGLHHQFWAASSLYFQRSLTYGPSLPRSPLPKACWMYAKWTMPLGNAVLVPTKASPFNFQQQPPISNFALDFQTAPQPGWALQLLKSHLSWMLLLFQLELSSSVCFWYFCPIPSHPTSQPPPSRPQQQLSDQPAGVSVKFTVTMPSPAELC